MPSKPTVGGVNSLGIRYVTKGPAGLRAKLNEIIRTFDYLFPRPGADIIPEVTPEGSLFRLRSAQTSQSFSGRIPLTFFTYQAANPAEVTVSAGAIGNIYLPSTTSTGIADGHFVWIEAIFDASSPAVLIDAAISAGANVPSDTSTSAHKLLARVTKTGGIASAEPLSWNWTDVQKCGGATSYIWGGIPA